MSIPIIMPELRQCDYRISFININFSIIPSWQMLNITAVVGFYHAEFIQGYIDVYTLLIKIYRYKWLKSFLMEETEWFILHSYWSCIAIDVLST